MSDSKKTSNDTFKASMRYSFGWTDPRSPLISFSTDQKAKQPPKTINWPLIIYGQIKLFIWNKLEEIERERDNV